MLRSRLILLAALLSLTTARPADLGTPKDSDKPWFYHDRDGPKFTTLNEWGDYSIRRYDSSVWASVCTEDSEHEEALWRGLTELMAYIKGDNREGEELWGGTPFAHHVSLTQDQIESWNATASSEAALDCVHKTICVAYFLPKKYQGDKLPPRPASHWVRVVRVPKWIGYVSSFDGFPTKSRMISHYMRLVQLLKIHKVPFNWRVAMGYMYDPPFVGKPEERHNEVLVPARRLDQLFGQDAEDLYADDKRVLHVRTTAISAVEGAGEQEIAAAL